jgi:hypothetical protein
MRLVIPRSQYSNARHTCTEYYGSRMFDATHFGRPFDYTWLKVTQLDPPPGTTITVQPSDTQPWTLQCEIAVPSGYTCTGVQDLVAGLSLENGARYTTDMDVGITGTGIQTLVWTQLPSISLTGVIIVVIVLIYTNDQIN